MFHRLVCIVLVVCTGCESDGGTKCSMKSSLTGTILSGAVNQPVSTDLIVRGVVKASPDVTIYGVQVNGVDATNAGADFDNWTVTLPIAVLVQQSDATGKVALTALATTNCGGDPVAVGTASVTVDRTPGIQVTQLQVLPMIPDGQSYLPSTKLISALVVVSGNTQAAGAQVALTASMGTITPPQVTLSGDGVTAAVAYALFSSTVIGTSVIVAAAKGQSGMGSVAVIGPPGFVPDGMQLVPGGRVRVTVVTSGRIDACQALPAFGMHVTSGAQDLMAGAGGVDLTGDGLIDIDVAVDATLSTRTQTVVSCRDPFGQLATAVFTAQP